PPASPGSNAALDEAIDRLRQVTGRPTGPRASGRPTDHPPTDSARQVEELVERVEKLEAELRRVWTRLVEVEATMKKRRRRR
ncbi:MAG: hypothetical protein RLZZ01_2189, partial [Actinomycetota bacterium]